MAFQNQMDYITIAEKQYFTTKEIIKSIFKESGFNVSFVSESIKGRFRAGYYKTKVTHEFKCFADKLKASRKVKLELDKLGEQEAINKEYYWNDKEQDRHNEGGKENF